MPLLEKLIQHKDDLGLSSEKELAFESAVNSATVEARKPVPDISILNKSIHFIQEILIETAKKEAGKLADAAVSADWPMIIQQLGHYLHHCR